MTLSLADTRRRARARRTGKKITKAQADYKQSSAPDEHSCGICAMFSAPDACTLVAGEIERSYGCKFFEEMGSQ